MQFFRPAIFLTALAAAGSAIAGPARLDNQVEARKSKCPKDSNVVEQLDGALEKLLPEIKPLLKGVDGLEDKLGEAIPAVKSLLKLLDGLCL